MGAKGWRRNLLQISGVRKMLGEKIMEKETERWRKRRKYLLAYYTFRKYFPTPLLSFLRRYRTRKKWREEYPDVKVKENLWPDGTSSAFVLTHDVESLSGVKMIDKIVKLEKDLGFRSSFNFVPERYPVPQGLIDDLKSEGFEVGVHGLKHDGLLFLSRIVFERRMEKIRKYKEKWGAVGFRSPSTIRNPEWIKEIPFLYDSSFPDWDPLEPIPGGCMSIYPFMLGNVVELPITLMQDHHLFIYLGRKDNEPWKRKFEWIRERGGMSLLIVHPDYMDEERLSLYRDFLEYVKEYKDVWHALPRKIAEWMIGKESTLKI